MYKALYSNVNDDGLTVEHSMTNYVPGGIIYYMITDVAPVPTSDLQQLLLTTILHGNQNCYEKKTDAFPKIFLQLIENYNS